MGETTSISWTDHTFNPWIGCSKVSPGCAHCYAETQDRRWGHDRWGVGKARVLTSAGNWAKPLLWARKARVAGERRRVFCASLADIFDEEVPVSWLGDLAALIARTAALDWLLLTKRPENYWRWRVATGQDAARPIRWPSNVWLGVTVENQEQAERRIPLLLEQESSVRFISGEPLLEGVDLSPWLQSQGSTATAAGVGWSPGAHLSPLHWVIIGGESGPKARRFELAWARDLVRQCRAMGVAPFVKQLGALPTSSALDDMRHCGDTVPFVLRLKDGHGGDMAEWPEDLRVREYPVVRR